MRIKILGKIIETADSSKTNYDNHAVYSMILNNLSPEKSQILHEKKKFFRLFTFTNVYVNKNIIHLYISGKDDLIMDLCNNLSRNNLIRLDSSVISITSIEMLNQLKKQINDTYLFKTRVIIGTFNKETKKKELADLEITKKRLIKNSLDKCRELGIGGQIRSIEIIQPKVCANVYKNYTIKSYKCQLLINGDYDIVNAIFNVGIGESTSSGHGFLWEVGV